MTQETEFEKARRAIAAGEAQAYALWVLLTEENQRDGYALKPMPWEGPGQYQHVRYADGRDGFVYVPGWKGLPVLPYAEARALEARALEARWKEAREAPPARQWVYGWNQPGFLPEDTSEADTWEEARDCLIWEIERWDGPDAEADKEAFAAYEAEAKAAIEALRAATAGQPLDVSCGGSVWFIAAALGATGRETPADAPADAGEADFHLGARSRAAILAGLYLLEAHATDGYESPEILEVGAEFTGLDPLAPHEIRDLIRVIAGRE